jgi:hypothetical protein
MVAISALQSSPTNKRHSSDGRGGTVSGSNSWQSQRHCPFSTISTSPLTSSIP